MKNIYFIKENGTFDKFEVADNFPDLPQFVSIEPDERFKYPIFNSATGRWEENTTELIDNLKAKIDEQASQITELQETMVASFEGGE